MAFLNSWALWIGAALLALPVVIHFLTRPRPMRLPLSTIRFVQEAIQQRRARHRLRDWIILLLRTAAVALLAFAFARPLLHAQPAVTPGKSGSAVKIILLDESQGMGEISRGVSSFERARAAAARYLTYDPDTRGNLILAGAQPHVVFDRLSSNAAGMRDELASAKVRTERLNAQAAINAAAEMLAKVPPGVQRELVIVSNFQRTSWANADFSPLPAETQIQLESVAPKETPPNLAVLQVRAQGRIEQGRDVRVEVEIGNYSPAASDVQVELTLGTASYRLSGVAAAGAKTVLSTNITLRDAGWQAGKARLVGVEDALAADDERSFVLNVRPPPTYALITRESSEPHPSSSHYLERAITPFRADEGHPGERVMRIDPDQLDRDSIASAELLVLDHPGRLSAPAVNLISTLMRRGRSVLYIASEPADAGNLRLIADALGSDLKMPVEFTPPIAGAQRRDLFLAEIRRDQQPFLALGENVAAATSGLRFAGGLDTHRLEGGLADDIVASYSDRSAAIVVTPCGAGQLAVVNADLAASNLRSSPVFVPLIGELIGRLLDQHGADNAYPCGEPLAVYLPPDAGTAAGLTLADAQQDAGDFGTLAEEGSFVVWQWPAAGSAGAYQVLRNNKPVFMLAAAAPPQTSDLESIDPAVLKDRLAGGHSISYQSADQDEDHKDNNAWTYFAVAVAACMMVELAALKLFRT